MDTGTSSLTIATINGQPLQSGKTYSFRAQAFDAAGLASPVSAPVSVLVDTAKPVCAISSLADWVTKSPFEANWTSADTGGAGVDYVVLEFSASTSGFTFLNASAPEDGSMPVLITDANDLYLRCRAIDFAGNVGLNSANEKVSADFSGPAIVINAPTSISLFKNFSVTANVQEALTNISSVSLEFAGSVVPDSAIIKDELSKQWNVTWTVPSYQKNTSTYSFKVSATDYLGNVRNSTQQVTIVFCVNGDTKSCGSPVGACGVKLGTQACVNNDWGTCENSTLPGTEVCNGIDDDCDGTKDENLTQVCGGLNGATVGICKTGTQACTNGTWGTCTGSIGPAPADVCGNGLDDNCNQLSDEGCQCVPGSQQACGKNEGVCVEGVQHCQADSTWGACEGSVNPTQEICGNEKDENCDGEPDDGCDEFDTCFNGEMDEDEVGIDCGGICEASCQGLGLRESPYFVLTLAGGGILVGLVVVVLFLRSRGKELTWDDLMGKYAFYPLQRFAKKVFSDTIQLPQSYRNR